ncbi:MAG: hypothetical protein KAI66_21035, partial [Lentisphaeria bacterium]|nr:hypothetical protein [Lentisphaeria bacterium]
MDAPFQIESLEVVGYATSLSEAMVPTLVTPVFRIREKPETIVFPPFVIHQGLVRDGTAGTAEELGQFVSKGDITLLPQPCPAQAVYELWVDDSITAHYEPMDDVDRKLGEIAERSMKDAVHAL